ncbi:MAG: DUF885 domain-containing protein [Xanthomonadales bacterium]|nr:DUF885 domain-containing protein [Gammaproteobacteria bacterium]MBT8076792.1 DUF885 domain-containing protein [Gammaproteobacteria bacterium]NNK03106.1 DUF885 domain-containing protein [Xanthomonadales bacterium]NNK99989.1 DUF885 domain-containing protein [Xanthomonadales bacterium]
MILLIACQHVLAAPANVDQLQRLSIQFVDKYRKGSSDNDRTDWSASSFLQEIESQQESLRQLRAIDPAGLSIEQDIDRRLLIGIARSDNHTALKQRRWENDAAMYLPSSQLGQLFEPAFAGTGGQRLQQISTLLNALPERLEQARKNLKQPPRRFTEAAIFQARRSLKTLADGRAGLLALDAYGSAVFDQAEAALQDYLAFLEQDLLARSTGSWELGREAYDFILQKRWYMDADAEQILQRGLQAFEATGVLAQAVAARIQPGKHWTEVFETLKDRHPPADGIKQAYQQQMDAARAFVIENSVVTLPEGERVITIDTPPAMRRSSPFGTFQTADPFDGGLEGRLILTPIEAWMTPEQQAQRLRSHSAAWIPVIAVHEAYPGHHAQALKVNENPNLLRRVVSESIFSEGWGLFTEELMFELGFLQGDDVRLTQLRNRLWRAARVILDVSLHTGQMSFDEAVEFLVKKVRFEPYAAELEVGMYIRNPTYVLGYLIGMQEIAAIRADYIALHGEPRPPSEFYDRLLRIGSIPPALLREELLTDAGAASDSN